MALSAKSGLVARNPFGSVDAGVIVCFVAVFHSTWHARVGPCLSKWTQTNQCEPVVRVISCGVEVGQPSSHQYAPMGSVVRSHTRNLFPASESWSCARTAAFDGSVPKDIKRTLRESVVS
jgi:hypothetical protein